MNKEKLSYYMEHEEELPPFAYSVNEVEGTVIILRYLMGGYFPTKCDAYNIDEAKAYAEKSNKELGVTEEQAEAMKIKSIFAWK